MIRGVYEIRNGATGERYIGSSKDCEARWKRHQQQLSSGSHANGRLKRAWVEHGPEAFSFSIIEEVECTVSLAEREQVYLPSGEYNIMKIAVIPPGNAISASTKGTSSARRSAALIGNQRGRRAHRADEKEKMKQVLSTPEVRAKLSAAQKGRKQSEIQVAKRVAKQLGQKRTREQKARMSAAGMGRILTPEHRQHISAALKGKKRPARSDEARSNARIARLAYLERIKRSAA